MLFFYVFVVVVVTRCPHRYSRLSFYSCINRTNKHTKTHTHFIARSGGKRAISTIVFSFIILFVVFCCFAYSSYFYHKISYVRIFHFHIVTIKLINSYMDLYGLLICFAYFACLQVYTHVLVCV